MASDASEPAACGSRLRKRKEEVGNLGWLAGSTLQPRKRQDIEGACGVLGALTADSHLSDS